MSDDIGASSTETGVEDLAAIRSRVINVVGHELRTPVTVIHGLAEQLARATELDAVTEEIAPALLRNTRRLTRLLDDLLVASGISTAVPTEDPAPVDLAALIAERWSGMSDRSLALGGDVQTMNLLPQSVVLALDAVLHNAAQYGTDTAVQVASTDRGARVTIASTGGRITDDELRLATQPFFRGEYAVTTRPGLGLGLAVADQVLRHIGGRLELSRDGQDTLVTDVWVVGT
ncbi:sensor histidine kinase [Euzebya tangerina]|uniref:sensor histidine kinase n=1 Tax=Euzebya tangerina TaxID=591198 RepID=UPI0013C348B7|nr:HAMP domain-containing sensor histidine kinase [Euzebya tangerina]